MEFVEEIIKSKFLRHENQYLRAGGVALLGLLPKCMLPNGELWYDGDRFNNKVNAAAAFLKDDKKYVRRAAFFALGRLFDRGVAEGLIDCNEFQVSNFSDLVNDVIEHAHEYKESAAKGATFLQQ